MKYKYIYFVLESKGPKTNIWECRTISTSDILGIIKWYGPWRQYCFFPAPMTVFNVGCMYDIIEFIQKQMDAKK